eukprot:CAMPEP_0178439198 /NCGR_PEP_ID=MMETSP0689_2-20121128/36025_1 /TAXON_ID=160604 /ORGANISM="Amphidinium massartii, Strain CS-259" /LENGTH=329 /DNA_ID=CAMNT_0020061705 /DNA_START=28 /DNA_END=1018 /DNA_ORIENTATION=+
MDKSSGSTKKDFSVDLKQFPPVECLIGYGSGVFHQHGYSASSRPMVDMILVVKDDDLEDWHKENLAMNSHHYAPLMRFAGATACSALQRTGPGLFYNPGVQLATGDGEHMKAKYGIITEKAFIEDLTTWKFLYAAGRLQKPCLVTFPRSEFQEQITEALRLNRRAALCAALLQSSWSTGPLARIAVLQLLTNIVQLSYSGDVRMGVAEDPKKVSNIVKGQATELWSIYADLVQGFGLEVETSQDGNQDAQSLESIFVHFDVARRREMFDELPAVVRTRSLQSSEAAVGRSLQGLVRRSSLQQTAKGFLTAGPMGSLLYSLRKLGKRFKV